MRTSSSGTKRRGCVVSDRTVDDNVAAHNSLFNNSGLKTAQRLLSTLFAELEKCLCAGRKIKGVERGWGAPNRISAKIKRATILRICALDQLFPSGGVHNAKRLTPRLALAIALPLALTACAPRAYPSCTGWERQTPKPATQAWIINNDAPFAGQVLSHERYGQLRGCWR